MTTLQLYINDQLVDLSDDSPVALTFQINNLAEVKNQQGNTSNQFKLPLTQRNRQILGFPDDIAFATEAPYDNYAAKIVQDGLEIIPYGIAVLNGVEQDSAAVTVLSGNVDFFDAIDGRLYDMGDKLSVYGLKEPFKQYDHNWSVQNVVRSQTKTNGWIWPVVDYGNMVYNAFGDNTINIKYLRPGFFIKTAIDMMLANAGYKGKGDLFENPVYPLLIAQFSNSAFEHGTDYQNQPAVNGCIISNGQDITISRKKKSGLLPGGELSFLQIDSDPTHHFANGRYTAKEVITVDVSLAIPKFYLKGRASGSHKSDVHISIVVDTPGLPRLYQATEIFDFTNGYDFPRDDGDGGSITAHKTFYKKVITVNELSLAAGQQVLIVYDFHGEAPYSFVMYAGATFTVTAINQIVLPGQQVQCERIFPDISQKDLIKDVLQRFGIICQTDSTTRTVNFASFRGIVNNIPIAKNWTTKCLNQGKTVSFQLGNYAQVNHLRHKEDDAILPAGFGDSYINVKDKTLPPTADLIQSHFAPSLNRPYFGGTAAQIKMIDSESESDEFGINVSPRILVDNKVDLRELNGRTIKFTDGDTANDLQVNDIVSIPYFYKPDGDHNLCFADMPGIDNSSTQAGLKTLYYPELEKILQQTKKVDRYFMLGPRDILELDLLIPVYLEQDSAYYYINKIDSWRKGQPVKVELVKLG